MVRGVPHFVLALILADIVTAVIFNETVIEDLDNELRLIETRRQGKKKSQSTSSDGNRRSGTGEAKASSDESLAQSFTGVSSGDTDEPKRVTKDRTPKSTAERKGWRKWHRKCPKCPDDMQKKWRDPSIKWICGAYQRARRTFKSVCMMIYRNCQDGTMFTKIANHRCPNPVGEVRPYGEHFFYDYHVVLTDDDTEKTDDEVSASAQSDSSWSESRMKTIATFIN